MSFDPASIHLKPGHSSPLGATWDGAGTNFAVFSAHARRIDVCLYGDDPAEPVASITLSDRTNNIWHGYVNGVGPGTRYGLRAFGEYDGARGLRFNDAKLLVDPYAKAIDGKVAWGPAIFGYDQTDPEDELSIDPARNDASMPKAVVVDPSFDWGADRPPNTPWPQTVVYETHVKGLTARHPGIPDAIRGTYPAVGHPAITNHLRALGVTAIELLPVHAFVDDPFLVDRRLSNYWGYSSLGFFAPDGRYASTRDGMAQVSEFKEMVKALHAAGIEVILDVVYNHTCEGNHLGPTLSFRGLDNPSYYHLLPNKPEYYLDFTGTGNTVNADHPQVLTMILDSLRYWVTEMHVDGFRFDLASAVGRETYDFDPGGGFFDAIHQDPVLSQIKLIAEPWDIGEGGYQVGNFPLLWSEWNDKFRDSVRAFWNENSRAVAEMGYRLTGSSDLYERSGRGPRASINFVTAHDGFTLRDLVSYNEKHNEANFENGRDGHDHNLSTNYGVEGQATDPAIRALRSRQQRNMLATVMLSQGVPMLLGGDEFNRTQGGNNNAYCQDNETSWFDWDLDDEATDLCDFVKHLIDIRATRPILRRRRFFKGRPETPIAFNDVSWIRPDGLDMTDADWAAGAETIALRLAGDAIEESDAGGEPITEPSILMLLHAGAEPIEFALPPVERAETERTWSVILDTNQADGSSTEAFREHSLVEVPARTFMVFEGCDELDR